MYEWGDVKRTQQWSGIERRWRFRQITTQGNDLCTFGAQKATCTSHQMRRSCSSHLKLLLAKKVLKNSRHSCNEFCLPLSPTLPPLHFPLLIFFCLFGFFHTHILLHLYTLASHAKFAPPFYLSSPLYYSPLSFYVFFCPPASSLHHFSGRELGPSLGCFWPGLLAAK